MANTGGPARHRLQYMASQWEPAGYIDSVQTINSYSDRSETSSDDLKIRTPSEMAP
jgi:hypothetical protein